MEGTGKTRDTSQHFYTVAAWVVSGITLLTLLPVCYLSFFDYANGDDLKSGAAGAAVIRRGGNPFLAAAGVLRAACRYVREMYIGWQGTWSSEFLFALEPSIWGERVYSITLWIALLCVLGGTAFCFSWLLENRLGLGRTVTVIVMGFYTLIGVQYLWNIKFLYWWTGVAHYMIPFGAAMVCAALAERRLEIRSRSSGILLVLLMTYLGGAGYPALVMAFVLVLAAVVRSLRNSSCGHGRRAVLLLSIFLLLTGFAVSAAAPGNRVRGGEDFGFSAERVLKVLLQAPLCLAADLGALFVRVPLLVPVLLLMVAMIWDNCSVREKPVRAKTLAYTVSGWLVCAAAVHLPELYAGVEVSGGVPDSYFLVNLVLLFIGAVQFGAYLGGRFPLNAGAKAHLRRGTMAVSLVLCLLFSKRIIKGSTDWMLGQYIRSGQLRDYRAQMQERLAILTDPSVQNAVVPEMNPEQGPYMHMALLADPEAFTNAATAAFYGKESVVALPREAME